MKIHGSISNIIFENDDNFAIFNFDLDQGKDTAVTGYFPSIAEGEYLELTGEYVTHPLYGKQFRAKDCRKLIPDTPDNIIRLLSGGLFSNIGPVRAQAIVDTLGTEAIRVLESGSPRILKVPGIGPKSAKILFDTLDIYKGKLEVIKWMVDYGFTSRMINQIVSHYSEGQFSSLLDNPYDLTDIPGIGFLRADSFAIWCGIDPNDPVRIRKGIMHILSNSKEGATYIPTDLLHVELNELLGRGVSDDLFQDALVALEGANPPEVITKPWGVHASQLYFAEVSIAQRLITLVQNRKNKTEADVAEIHRHIDRYAASQGLFFNKRQRHAILRSMIEGVSILTGGPGTGKTLTVGAIVHLHELFGRNVALCAFTGRAAKRITESTGYEASTIHRLLGATPGEFGKFRHNKGNPLPHDLIIVDETSTVEVPLMRALLEALEDDAAVVFVGDNNQLPSIGPGSVLGDMIASNTVAFTNLAQIYRQDSSSLIVLNAHKIMRGETAIDPGGRGKSFLWYSGKVTPDTVAKTVREFIPDTYGIPPDKTIVLSPLRKAGGALNVNNLNVTLQAALNPKGRKIPSDKVSYRIGDPVVHNKNDIQKGVYNGDVGTITNIDHVSSKNAVFNVDYYGSPVQYDLTEVREIELAYAISIHRFMGSEQEAVVIVIPDEYAARRMMLRNLLYTAVTRSKKVCILFGSEQMVKTAIRNNSVYKRKTKLEEFLRHEFYKQRRHSKTGGAQ